MCPTSLREVGTRGAEVGTRGDHPATRAGASAIASVVRFRLRRDCGELHLVATKAEGPRSVSLHDAEPPQPHGRSAATDARVDSRAVAGTILALDLGTTTGWALRGPTARSPAARCRFRPSRYDGGGMRYLRFRSWLDQLADERRPDRRDPLRRSATAHRDRRGAHLWRSARHAHRVGRAARRSPTKARRSARSNVTSPARATPTKTAVIAAVRARGFSPADDNEADALAILLWAIDTRGGVR